jgi:hypothetical protein
MLSVSLLCAAVNIVCSLLFTARVYAMQVESLINTRTILQKTPEVARAMITGARQVRLCTVI